jgi:hypothetical protein
MIFSLCRTSDPWDTPPSSIDIETLEALIEFVREYKRIIIEKSYKGDHPYTIEIYDDWRE